MRASFLLLAGVLVGLLLTQSASATSFAPPGPGAGAEPSIPSRDRVDDRVPEPIAADTAGPGSFLPGPDVMSERTAESLEEYRTNSLFMLRLSLMGLVAKPPTGPGWVAFSVGAETADALRVWTRTDPDSPAFLLTAPSLLGVADEVVLEASANPGFLEGDASPAVATLGDLAPVPEPGTALLLGLGLLGLCRGALVR